MSLLDMVNIHDNVFPALNEETDFIKVFSCLNILIQKCLKYLSSLCECPKSLYPG